MAFALGFTSRKLNSCHLRNFVTWDFVFDFHEIELIWGVLNCICKLSYEVVSLKRKLKALVTSNF
jgi:hypothetical protein